MIKNFGDQAANERTFLGLTRTSKRSGRGSSVGKNGGSLAVLGFLAGTSVPCRAVGMVCQAVVSGSNYEYLALSGGYVHGFGP
jgi:hypothetical protein